jgi:hypothetical protein
MELRPVILWTGADTAFYNQIKFIYTFYSKNLAPSVTTSATTKPVSHTTEGVSLGRGFLAGTRCVPTICVIIYNIL